MRRLTAAVAAAAVTALIAALLVASAQAAPSRATVWSAAGTVRAPGGPFLTDAPGRRLELHGIDLVGKCGGGAIALIQVSGSPCIGPPVGPRLAYVLSPDAADPARRFTAGDARTLARLGFDVVRLGIMWEGLEPGPPGAGPNLPAYCRPQPPGRPFPALGRADPYRPAVVAAYLRRTDRIVGLLAAAGIRVILDMHQDAWGSVFGTLSGPTPWIGDGAPPWATCTGTATFIYPAQWPGAYFDVPVDTAVHHFFANDVRGDLLGQYARVWQAVAAHYRGNQNVIGYDLYNEPNDFLTQPSDAELQCDYGGPVREPMSCAGSGARPPRDGLIGAIQAVDPGHVVFYEPPGTTNFGVPETIGIHEPLRFADLGLAFHMYGDAARQIPLVGLERAITHTAQPGGPAEIMDEFGATGDPVSTAATVALADQSGLSWSYWSALQLDDPTAGSPTEGLLNQKTGRPYPALAHSLAVPYLAATAGTIGPTSYDPSTGTFTFSYRVAHRIAAPTLIQVPRYTYPNGYGVLVKGAVVVSRPGARVLALAASRRATLVLGAVIRRSP
jgi:endoglycosylceramidase